MVREAGAGAAESAALLAAAASEKYRAALETRHASSDACTPASRAVVFMDWGDALRLAAESSAEAAAASGLSGDGGVTPEECWQEGGEAVASIQHSHPPHLRPPTLASYLSAFLSLFFFSRRRHLPKTTFRFRFRFQRLEC